MSYSVLMVFSCPNDQKRLRLDREHSWLKKIIDSKDAQGKIKILQAATINELIEAISSPNLRVVHFSGHGSHNSIYLEKTLDEDVGEELNVKILSKILQEHCPNLETLILASCYSADGINQLIKSASKIITVKGEAGDNAAIEFTKHFYENYLNGVSVDKSIIRAQLYLQAHNIADNFRILVTRRGLSGEHHHPLIQAVKNKRTEESILIDISDVESCFELLTINRDEFISKLASKIKIHHWLVYQTSDMEHAILSFGRYHAIFSWEIGMDLVKCRKIIRLKKGVSEKQSNAWIGLALRYNQLFALPYRSYRNAEPLTNGSPSEKLNRHQLRPFRLTAENFFSEQTEFSEAIQDTIPDDIKLFAPTIIHNFNLAMEEFSQENSSQSIIHLETTLSAIHSVLELLTENLSE